MFLANTGSWRVLVVGTGTVLSAPTRFIRGGARGEVRRGGKRMLQICPVYSRFMLDGILVVSKKKGRERRGWNG